MILFLLFYDSTYFRINKLQNHHFQYDILNIYTAILFVFLGGKVVLGGSHPPLLVGFLCGVAGMLAQLFLVLMAVFFTLSTEATNNGYATAPADSAFGAFALINMIIYIVWAIILGVHRQSVIDHSFQPPVHDEQEGYEHEHDHRANPAADHGYTEEGVYNEDEVMQEDL